MRLIDADKLPKYTGYALSASDVAMAVENAPTVDAVPVRHGRWIDSEEDGHPTICGVCNYPVDRFFKTKFCPECGAKMTEDHHEQKE